MSPSYVNRPVFELAEDRAQRPVVHGATIELWRGSEARGDIAAEK